MAKDKQNADFLESENAYIIQVATPVGVFLLTVSKAVVQQQLDNRTATRPDCFAGFDREMVLVPTPSGCVEMPRSYMEDYLNGTSCDRGALGESRDPNSPE